MLTALIFAGAAFVLALVGGAVLFRDRVLKRPVGIRTSALLMGLIGLYLVALMVTVFVERGGHV